MQQLLPNSRELSMSSAKTIADILAFAELIDAKSFIGNPFTSQPIYIAACAFLMESAFYSEPSSRSHTPRTSPAEEGQEPAMGPPSIDVSATGERNSTTKHSLLAAAAKENYQRCYKALESLETYWEGTKYILTALDQKAKGIWDPLLYTDEEMDSAGDLPTAPGLAPPGWKRAPSENTTETAKSSSANPPAGSSDDHSKIDPSKGSLELDPFSFVPEIANLSLNSNWLVSYGRHRFITAKFKFSIPQPGDGANPSSTYQSLSNPPSSGQRI